MSAENAQALQGFCVILLFVNLVIMIRSTRRWSNEKKLSFYPLMYLINGFAIAVILLPWES